jgi:hypothetical protein
VQETWQRGGRLGGLGGGAGGVKLTRAPILLKISIFDLNYSYIMGKGAIELIFELKQVM